MTLYILRSLEKISKITVTAS